MGTRERIRSFTDSFGHEIDRLIRQLPGADPKLQGDPEPASFAAAGPPARPSQAFRSPALPTRSPGETAAAERRMALAGVWLRVSAAAGLGVATVYWPYANSCGWMLHAYLGVVAAVLISGFWASWTAWKVRVAVAHAVSLLVVFWGIVLAAEQLLPRIGYATVEAAWRCGVR
ncbi:MAG: hypothetical protein K1X31_10560 [Gemmatimonadaceae bacterium]|nr:hypothetical protein [Gemmatimonadaceae bacterium]